MFGKISFFRQLMVGLGYFRGLRIASEICRQFQTVYRIFDYNLPRDASDQYEHGTEIQFDHIEAGDLAFFENKSGKIIHVGILDGNGKIIHASGHVRTDSITQDGIIHSITGDLTHKLTKIKRL